MRPNDRVLCRDSNAPEEIGNRNPDRFGNTHQRFNGNDFFTALKAFDLQGVFSMSTGNIPYAFEHCDWLVVVSKEERRIGKRMEIRNTPVSLSRESDDARRFISE